MPSSHIISRPLPATDGKIGFPEAASGERFRLILPGRRLEPPFVFGFELLSTSGGSLAFPVLLGLITPLAADCCMIGVGRAMPQTLRHARAFWARKNCF